MSKRKCPAATLATGPHALSSLDAALDLLACETFSRVDALAANFQACVGVKLQDGVVRTRWEEAVKRYWLMKNMGELTCSSALKKNETVKVESEAKATDDFLIALDRDWGEHRERRDAGGRALPDSVYPGVVVVHDLCPNEEAEWRRWQPKVGDVVLVDTREDGHWPGKIIDKKTFYSGRSPPRGNHFFPVRIYNDQMSPTVTIKSRLIPLSLRSDPPLLASPTLLSAYHHAAHPESFDLRASVAEAQAAQDRTRSGEWDEASRQKAKADKEAWNQLVNWVMNERRVEKLRVVNEERRKRLAEVSQSPCPPSCDETKLEDGIEDCFQKRARHESSFTSDTESVFKSSYPNGNFSSTSSGCGVSIFGPAALSPSPSTTTSTRRTISPLSASSYIRPALSTPQRPRSPRRLDKRRTVFAVGEFLPRGRGGTYTPPRILPSGDETAPGSSESISPVPSRQKFDFVSPLGPKMRANSLYSEEGRPRFTRADSLGVGTGLEVVKEEPEEGWMMVGQRKMGSKRAGSAPCREAASEIGGEGMEGVEMRRRGMVDVGMDM
ncbi:hypothetical protein M231_05635 [Tremella mesenterica]|uniref:PWWP domain-containing protein n=1 Tax=Tremella mesenterica TaxID=5217 RepID=A0A4V1M3J1_TREME|nr:hypothetical protein M231_05635 [Tremella mesenterica]